MAVFELGCCGAYCKPCRAYVSGACKGCKLGYDTGARDILKAKCAIKVCCIGNGNISCADCADYEACAVLNGFYRKNGYKYQKYRQATGFILRFGYDAFFQITDAWTGAFGQYPKAAPDADEKRE